MTEKPRCEICDRMFSSLEGLEHHNRDKHSENKKEEKKPINRKKIKNGVIFVLIAGFIVAGLIWAFASAETFPPTDMKGHVESNPVAHILKEPMPITIQKHMLEHADGIEGGRAGVIINYNCKDYQCEGDLIDKLESFANQYNYVYVAPFKGMDARIALTKLGKIEVMEEFNEMTIKQFIEGR